jgi:hypothetical protein
MKKINADDIVELKDVGKERHRRLILLDVRPSPLPRHN